MTVQRRPRLKAEPAGKQKLRLWIRLLRASRMIEAELRERLRLTFATTLPKFDVMAALARKPAGMTMTELSRFLMVSNGNVTGIIDRLVADGLVVRTADEDDRRATFVRLTRKGTQNFEAMAGAHEGWVNELLMSLSREETDAMIAMLGGLGSRLAGGRRP
ncbi:MAG: MarR family transcriptional regulator [Hyphomicrobiaceae bacterium]|nr:MAG: MarR family transcriptional regulator [Hyphomicrobiaceae bacterium]